MASKASVYACAWPCDRRGGRASRKHNEQVHSARVGGWVGVRVGGGGWGVAGGALGASRARVHACRGPGAGKREPASWQKA